MPIMPPAADMTVLATIPAYHAHLKRMRREDDQFIAGHKQLANAAYLKLRKEVETAVAAGAISVRKLR
jgi:hypothetical protein